MRVNAKSSALELDLLSSSVRFITAFRPRGASFWINGRCVSNEDSILIEKRYDVCDSSHSRQPHRRHEKHAMRILHTRRSRSQLAQSPCQLECNARSAQTVEWIRSSGGWDGQSKTASGNCPPHRWWSVMIKSTPSGFASLSLCDGGDTTVHADDEFSTALHQAFDRFGTDAVTVLRVDWGAKYVTSARAFPNRDHDGGGGHAVGVIISIDGDRFLIPDRFQYPFAADSIPGSDAGSRRSTNRASKNERACSGAEIPRPYRSWETTVVDACLLGEALENRLDPAPEKSNFSAKCPLLVSVAGVVYFRFSTCSVTLRRRSR
jgi:hypothetical protein